MNHLINTDNDSPMSPYYLEDREDEKESKLEDLKEEIIENE